LECLIEKKIDQRDPIALNLQDDDKHTKRGIWTWKYKSVKRGIFSEVSLTGLGGYADFKRGRDARTSNLNEHGRQKMGRTRSGR